MDNAKFSARCDELIQTLSNKNSEGVFLEFRQLLLQSTFKDSEFLSYLRSEFYQDPENVEGKAQTLTILIESAKRSYAHL